MSRIPVSRVLSTVEYTGARRSVIADAVGLAGGVSGSSLAKIKEAHKIRIEQINKKGYVDECGLREFQFDDVFPKFLKGLTGIWISFFLYDKWEEQNREMRQSDDPWERPWMSGSPILYRTISHLTCLPHKEMINKGEFEHIMSSLSHVFLPELSRIYLMENLEGFTRRKWAVKQIIKRYSKGGKMGMPAQMETEEIPKNQIPRNEFPKSEFPKAATKEDASNREGTKIIEENGGSQNGERQIVGSHNGKVEESQKSQHTIPTTTTPMTTALTTSIKSRKVEDYTTYTNPRTFEVIHESLFPDVDLAVIPEGVSSVLCRAFWPLLRMMVTSDDILFKDMLTHLGYSTSEDIGEQDFGSGHSERSLPIRILMDVLKECPKEEREVPLAFLQALVNTNQGTWEAATRHEEYRAHIMRLLLENKENCLKIFDAEALCIAKNGPKQPNQTTPRLVLDYLYTPVNDFKHPTRQVQFSLKYFNETADINYKSILQINSTVAQRSLSLGIPGAWLLAVPPNPIRESHTLHKLLKLYSLGSLSIATLVVGFMGPALFKSFTLPTQVVLNNIGKTAVGAIAMEGLFRAEEFLIDSKLYYESKAVMMASSLLMVPINAATLGLCLAKAKWSCAVLIHMRKMDQLNDTYRAI